MRMSRPLRWAPLLLAGGLALAGCTSDVTPDADGNYVGVVTSVGEDTLQMDVDTGGNMRVDTFAVCGDATATFISVGDRLTVTATREAVDFDATAILNEDGQPACQSAPATTEDGDTDSGSGGTGETGTVTLQEAEQIALEFVGEGTVTFSGPEDDRGATWEIEVTREDGSEVDVLVDAQGNVIN